MQPGFKSYGPTTAALQIERHHYPLTTAVDRRRACAILNFLGLPRRSPLSDHMVGILLSPGRDFRQTLHHAT
jgi:hypothetical protein